MMDDSIFWDGNLLDPNFAAHYEPSTLVAITTQRAKPRAIAAEYGRSMQQP